MIHRKVAVGCLELLERATPVLRAAECHTLSRQRAASQNRIGTLGSGTRAPGKPTLNGHHSDFTAPLSKTLVWSRAFCGRRLPLCDSKSQHELISTQPSCTSPVTAVCTHVWSRMPRKAISLTANAMLVGLTHEIRRLASQPRRCLAQDAGPWSQPRPPADVALV